MPREDMKCPICRDRFDPQSMYVDYMPEIGFVRGIICHKCWNGLRAFKEESTTLNRAKNYIATSGFGLGYYPSTDNVGGAQ